MTAENPFQPGSDPWLLYAGGGGLLAAVIYLWRTLQSVLDRERTGQTALYERERQHDRETWRELTAALVANAVAGERQAEAMMALTRQVERLSGPGPK